MAEAAEVTVGVSEGACAFVAIGVSEGAGVFVPVAEDAGVLVVVAVLEGTTVAAWVAEAGVPGVSNEAGAPAASAAAAVGVGASACGTGRAASTSVTVGSVGNACSAIAWRVSVGNGRRGIVPVRPSSPPKSKTKLAPITIPVVTEAKGTRHDGALRSGKENQSQSPKDRRWSESSYRAIGSAGGRVAAVSLCGASRRTG